MNLLGDKTDWRAVVELSGLVLLKEEVMARYERREVHTDI